MARLFSLITLVVLLLLSCSSQTEYSSAGSPIPLASQTTVPASPTLTPTAILTSTPKPPDLHIEIFPKDLPTDISTPTVQDMGIYLSNRRILSFINDKPILRCQVTANYAPSFEYFLIVAKCNAHLSKAYLFRTSDGRRTDMTADKDALWESFSWSPQGHFLLYHRNYCCSDDPHLPDGVMLYNLVTGSQIYLSSAGWRWQLPEWSPDGHWLAYLTSACRIQVMDVETYQLWSLDSIPNCADDGLLTWSYRTDNSLLLQYGSASTADDRQYRVGENMLLSKEVLPHDPVIP